MAAVIPLIQDMVGFLSQDPLTVEDVAARVGTALRDPGIPMPIELNPKLPGVHSAKLARYPDSGLPYLLDLELDPEARPTVAKMKAALGASRQAPTDRGRPRKVLFYPAAGPKWQVVIIAELAQEPGELETTPITTLALRRDPL